MMVKCTSKLILHKLLLHESGFLTLNFLRNIYISICFYKGNYGCNATLVAKNKSDSVKINFGDEVLLKVETSDITVIVVTSVLVAILVLFLIISVCFKLAGHQLTWEKQALIDDEIPLDNAYRRYSVDHEEDVNSR